MLERIRQLSNENIVAAHKIVSIILVGQPELRERTREIKQLFTRIKIRQYLNYLSPEDIEPYIRFKLNAATNGSYPLNPFEGLYQDLYRVSQGMPRFLNSICEALLTMAAEENIRQIPQVILKRFEESTEFREYLKDISADQDEATEEGGMDSCDQ